MPVCCVMKGGMYCSGLMSVWKESASAPPTTRTIAISVIRFEAGLRPVVSTSTTTKEASPSSIGRRRLSAHNKFQSRRIGGKEDNGFGYVYLRHKRVRRVEDHRIILCVCFEGSR